MVHENAEERPTAHEGFIDAAAFGFSPAASGTDNADALQAAIDQGGTIVVSCPGTYKLARTVYVGSHTAIRFGHGVFVKKVDEVGAFTHVLLNKGARQRQFDERILIEGLQIVVNDVDVRNFEIYGLHGQLAFFYVRELRIERFRCLDLGPAQYAIHVCTFEDIIIDDVVIKGAKDGVHLGRGNRFTIRNGVFQTFDDAVALNAHDWIVGNPELGWIENGVVEKCWDLAADDTTGFFCRLLAGGWIDWRKGMDVQQGDIVISDGRLYRVQAQPDGTVYTSKTKPLHTEGTCLLDGINWRMMQDEAVYTAGVRNVVFRDIFLEKARVGFSFMFSKNRFSRSYYPGAAVPLQEQFTIENVRAASDRPLVSISTPVDVLTIANSSLKNTPVVFHGDEAFDYRRTAVNMVACVFNHDGPMELLKRIFQCSRTGTRIATPLQSTI